MSNLISSLRAKEKKSLISFQRVICMSNASLKLRYIGPKARYNILYILPHHLNENVTEHFFGAIRYKRVLHDHPNPLEFKYRLRAYI